MKAKLRVNNTHQIGEKDLCVKEEREDEKVEQEKIQEKIRK